MKISTMSEGLAKMFCVVDFEEDSAVEAVPSNWVSQDTLTCLWPQKKPDNFLEIIQDPKFSPPKTWKAWNVKIIKSYGNAHCVIFKSIQIM